MTRPTDLPEIRQRMLDFYESDHGRGEWMAVAERAGFFGKPASRAEAEQALGDESMRWRMAELFYVTPEMTELARAASTSMPSYSLHAEDLPADNGIIYFDGSLGESFQSFGGDSRPALTIVAAVWGRMVLEDAAGTRKPGVWVSWYTDTRANREEALTAYSEDFQALAAASAAFDRRGPWTYDDEEVLLFGDESIDAYEGHSHKQARAFLLLCSWLLMQQTVASTDSEQPERSTRRRLAKAGVTEIAPIRVVSLRHRSALPTGRSEREYLHRWMVRGHWRRQWYPKQDRHVPIWISPHIKGPDGAPIMGGEKVYAWRR